MGRIHNIFKKRLEEGHCHNLTTRHHFDGESKLHSFFHLIAIQFVFVPAKFKGDIMKSIIAVLRLHFPTQSCTNCHRSTKAKEHISVCYPGTFSVEKVRMFSIFFFLNFFSLILMITVLSLSREKTIFYRIEEFCCCE